MTLNDYLHSGHGYDEVIVINGSGKELTSWQDNDPKYNARVISVVPVDNDTAARVMIDWI